MKIQQSTGKSREHNGQKIFSWDLVLRLYQKYQLCLIIYLLFVTLIYHLYQLPFPPHSDRQDNYAIAAIAMACLFLWVVDCRRRRHHYQSFIQYTRAEPLTFSVLLSGRHICIHCSEPAISVPSGVGQCCKFIITTPLFSSLSLMSP